MELTPKDLLKQYVDSQNFTSTTEIMQAKKDLFRDAIQQVMESELDVELGYEKSERMSDFIIINHLQRFYHIFLSFKFSLIPTYVIC